MDNAKISEEDTVEVATVRWDGPLLACPVNRKHAVGMLEHSGAHWVQCNDCGVSGPAADSAEAAARGWNAFKDYAEPPARLEAAGQKLSPDDVQFEVAMFNYGGDTVCACPFCESENTRPESVDWFAYGGNIVCNDCGASGPNAETPAHAAKLWHKVASGPTRKPGDRGITPKDLIGETKLPVDLCPALATAEQALAHYEGALKYGEYNWRAVKVRASIYVAAIQRHLLKWQAGRDRDPTSGAHELGHVMACCAILIDAEANDTLDDDRPKSGEVSARFEALRSRMQKCYDALKSAGKLHGGG